MPADRAPAEGERRHLTVFFCDLVGSTALGERLDPEDLVELIAAYHDAAAEVIERYHGHVAQYLGDGVLAYFGYPRAQGDDAVHAVRAGLDVVRAVHALTGTRIDGGPVRLAARVGIHTGFVVMSELGAGGRRQPLAVGDTVNVAARLEKLAEPGTVVVSAATERVTRGYFVFARRDAVHLRGVAGPVTVYGVADDTGIRTRLALAAASGLTPLVGRERELDVLEERWRLAREGSGQAVVVSGEPGIGKSRLVHELGRRVGDEATRLVFQASPYHASSALHPVVEELGRVFRIDGTARDDGDLVRLTDALERQGLSVEELRPALAALLSIAGPGADSTSRVAPQELKRLTFAALTALLAAEARQRPVLAIFEDVHWADPSTLELLGHLLAHAPGQRVLVVVTARPEFEPPWPADAFARLSLARLEAEKVEQLMAAVLGERSLPAGVRAEVADRAAGVPLFVEETLKMILESEGGHALAIPGTLQNALTARLDSLGDRKELAQLASVAALGGEFSFELLRAVTVADEQQLRRALDELVRAELLYERGAATGPVYVFKHALIREAAYGSLLRSARRRFHARIADVLDDAAPDLVESEPELIAQHLGEAGRTADAIRHWQRAGERALRAWATTEADTHFERGLELVASLPEGPGTRDLELELQLARGTALMATGGYAAPAAREAYARAEALSDEIADPSRLAPALYGLAAFHASTAQPRKAAEFGRRLHAVADTLGDDDVLIEANVILGLAEYLRGDAAAAETRFEQVLAGWEPARHRDHIFVYGQEPGVVGLTMSALTSGWLGRLDDALRLADEAELRGREVAHPLTLAYTLAGTSILHQLVGDVEEAERAAEGLVAVAGEHALPMWLAWGRTVRGWALLERGRVDEGMAEVAVGVAGAEIAQSSVMKIHFLAQLGATFGRLGHVDAGLAMVEQGLADLELTDERVCEAELHRSQGVLLLAGEGDRPAAERSFRQGIDVARRQGALLLELRSATALAELLAGDGRAGAARALLEDVTGRFTQGLGAPVLRDARGLLARIAGGSG
ncbi:MAG TPA: adenylate/guanylate cyclase domain-containing protein [Gaiellaceae bacterium]|nr:adenylate/guanylate cyclase domain-containing protein [Gaiellaceae bacterium]